MGVCSASHFAFRTFLVLGLTIFLVSRCHGRTATLTRVVAMSAVVHEIRTTAFGLLVSDFLGLLLLTLILSLFAAFVAA